MKIKAACSYPFFFPGVSATTFFSNRQLCHLCNLGVFWKGSTPPGGRWGCSHGHTHTSEGKLRVKQRGVGQRAGIGLDGPSPREPQAQDGWPYTGQDVLVPLSRNSLPPPRSAEAQDVTFPLLPPPLCNQYNPQWLLREAYF